MKTNEDFSMSMRVDTDDVELLAELACNDLGLADLDAEDVSDEEVELDRIYVRLPVVKRELRVEIENLRQRMRASFRLGRLIDGLSHLDHLTALAVFSKDESYNPKSDLAAAVQSCIDGRELFDCGDFDHLIAIGLNPLSGNLNGIGADWIECWSEMTERDRVQRKILQSMEV